MLVDGGFPRCSRRHQAWCGSDRVHGSGSSRGATGEREDPWHEPPELSDAVDELTRWRPTSTNGAWPPSLTTSLQFEYQSPIRCCLRDPGRRGLHCLRAGPARLRQRGRQPRRGRGDGSSSSWAGNWIAPVAATASSSIRTGRTLTGRRTLTVPVARRVMSIGTLSRLLKDADISRDEFRRLLRG